LRAGTGPANEDADVSVAKPTTLGPFLSLLISRMLISTDTGLEAALTGERLAVAESPRIKPSWVSLRRCPRLMAQSVRPRRAPTTT
jgi:hypothetical protein